MKRGLPTTDAAREIGINLSQYWQYENGECLPLRENYNKLVKYFGWEEWE